MIANKSTKSELSEPLIEEIKRMQFSPEVGHLPLANSPERFLHMMMLLKESDGKQKSVADLSRHFAITTRQINFYAETGDRTFGLFDRSEKGYVRLTPIGESVSNLPRPEQLAYLQSKLLRLPTFRHIKQQSHVITTKEIVSLLSENPVFRQNFSDSSLKRRAGTLLSWAKWFETNRIAIQDNEIADYIEKNKELIYEVVHRLKVHPRQVDDYFSVATIGLQQAFLHYDEKRDNKFSTFAFTCMQNEIFGFMRHERKWKRTVLVGMNAKSVAYSEDNDTGVREESFYAKEEKWMSEELSVEEECIRRTNIAKLLGAVKELPAREKMVIESFYLDELPQREIAVKLNMSQANISKIIAKTLRTLQDKLWDAVV